MPRIRNTLANPNSTYEALRSFNVKSYGAVDTTGAVDSSTAINAAVTACYNAGGGEVVFPAGTIKWTTSPTFPNDSASVPHQPPITLKGRGAVRDASWGVLSAAAPGATILVMGATTGPAQIDTRGLGTLAIKDLTFSDPNATSPIPFIQTTNTTLLLDNVSFYGAPTLTGSSCNKDAVVLGGNPSGPYSPNGTSNGPFQGYGTSLDNLFFSNVRRGIYGRTACNATVNTNCVWSSTCGADSTASAIEYDGTGLDDVGNLMVNPIIELTNYVYGVRFRAHGKNTLINPGFYDPGAGTLAAIRLEGVSPGNSAYGGFWGVTSDKYVSDGGSNTWTVFTGNGTYGYFRQGGGSGNVLVQPWAATGSETVVLWRVRRSDQEGTNPNQDIVGVQQNGTVTITGASAKLSGALGNLILDSTSFGLFRPSGTSGTVELDPGATTGSVKITRGLLRLPTFTTAARPAANAFGAGQCYYDTTVNKPVFSDGTTWRDATGTAV